MTGAKIPVIGEISSAMTPLRCKVPDIIYQLSSAGGKFGKVTKMSNGSVHTFRVTHDSIAAQGGPEDAVLGNIDILNVAGAQIRPRQYQISGVLLSIRRVCVLERLCVGRVAA